MEIVTFRTYGPGTGENSLDDFFFRSQKPAKRRGCFHMNLLGIEVDMALIVLGCVFGVLVIIHAAGLVHTSRS